MPLMLLGGINRLETMHEAMRLGFQYVALARALLREPDLVNRLQAGQARAGVCNHSNRCMPTIYTGTYCPLAMEAAAGGEVSVSLGMKESRHLPCGTDPGE